MNETIQYLKKKEWSMGNGQCPECCGVPKNWHGHPCHMEAESIGRKENCGVAKALICAGEKPLFIGEYLSTAKFEHFISENGILGTRRETKNGCHRVKKYNKKLKRERYNAMFDIMSKAMVNK